ncbi:MAG: N(G),N(G)-dimethylarginine dimethylaminohydrolase [Gracilimonas sp.]|uniref:dimethylarginine dimethylaminohydrolase family protein n=1 Tax=Gracilimonas sp. TaxID=1974203 RepID=UPI0019AC38FC|nr:arginine deiminase family protein [Gracilimonas sp.]MBD3615399.1 N(G),N(G)-dimethylarginine dimethylaminohydrolase [Gracilimonas sp.]
MFKNAIVRKPCPNMVEGITEANLGKPDYHKALLQHARYTGALRKLGLKIQVLEPDNRFPDSVFIEDVAVCTPYCAVITCPGAPSRRDEVSTIRDSIYSFYENVEQITEPGKLDGGDVMMAGTHFYIGLSGRTNKAGANQLIKILQQYNLSGSTVSLGEVLHLKTGISYLEKNNLLVSGEFIEKEEFRDFNKIIVPPEEAYAANCVWINGSVIIPAGYPVTQKNIEEAGYQTITVEMTEFEKLDGGLSCLSLRF